MMNQVLAILTALLIACSPVPKPSGEPAPSPAPHATAAAADAAPPTQSLPPGVLARAQGRSGLITVEERDGLRYLMINGRVQAAVPTSADRVGPDPVVALIAAARPAANKVLVIGLGSGKTATDLSAAGLQVHAVEIEPKVIEFAKTYFGYTGQAIARDGLEYLEKTTERYDVILIDAFTDFNPPRELVDAAAFGLMTRRLMPRGAIVLRGPGEPKQPPMSSIFATMQRVARRPVPHVLMLGSGVGDEMQNLYLIASPKPLNLVELKGLPLWPHRAGRGGPLPWSYAAVDKLEDKRGAAKRKLRAVGYLVRLTENGALALDMPHWEMGAVRFLLSGPKAAELAKLLPAKATFPTSGDIRSDGPTKKTMHEVLGGGGVKRSDLRFSTVIAQLEGMATLRSVVEPDAAGRVPPSVRDTLNTDKLLPYGGALYDLVVQKVDWTLDSKGWSRSKRVLGPLLRKAVKRIRNNDLAGAATELERYLAKLPSMLPKNLPLRRQMESLLAGIKREAMRAAKRPSGFDRAIACDRAAAGFLTFGYDDSGIDASRVHRTLLECAERNYKKTSVRPKAGNARVAAGRLLHLLQSRAHLLDNAAERRLEATIKKLRKRHPDLEPSETIPVKPVPSAR